MPDNTLQRDNITVIACRQCHSTLLEQVRVARFSPSDVSALAIEFHNLHFFRCVKCGEPVLTGKLKSDHHISLFKELVGNDKHMDAYICTTEQIDLTELQEQRKTLRRRAMGGDLGGGLPPIDPNKPIVKK